MGLFALLVELETVGASGEIACRRHLTSGSLELALFRNRLRELILQMPQPCQQIVEIIKNYYAQNGLQITKTD